VIGLLKRRSDMFWKAFGLVALLFCAIRGYQGDMQLSTFNAVFACLGLIMAKLEEKEK